MKSKQSLRISRAIDIVGVNYPCDVCGDCVETDDMTAWGKSSDQLPLCPSCVALSEEERIAVRVARELCPADAEGAGE